MRVVIRCVAVTILLSGSSVALLAQVISKSDCILSGTIVTDRNEVVANLKLRVTTSTRKIGEVTNSAGEFCVNLPDEAVKLEIVTWLCSAVDLRAGRRNDFDPQIVQLETLAHLAALQSAEARNVCVSPGSTRPFTIATR